MDSTSFASRRPAAFGLPPFQLPPPTPHVDVQAPRNPGTDGLSPLSSSVNSNSSQSSQAGGIGPYNPQGGWSLPGNHSSYTYSNMNQAQGGLMHPTYGSRSSMYSPSGNQYSARNSQSPATGEGLAAPPYDQVPAPFPLPVAGSSSHHSSLHPHASHNHQHQPLQSHILGSQAPASQPPTPSATSASESYPRPPPTTGYYGNPASSTPQPPSFSSYAPTHPSPTQPSPTTSVGPSRTISALSGHSPMHAPAYTRQYAYPLPTMGGAVLSNMANPGGQMTIVNGMGSMPPGYPPHLGPPHHMYAHGQPSPQNERPFKCDVCPQSFNRNHDLKRHKRIHLAVKPFPCKHCDKSFSRKDALKRHRMVKGCGNGKTSPTGTNASSPQPDTKPDPDGHHDSKEN